jgi:hypothetical protein
MVTVMFGLPSAHGERLPALGILTALAPPRSKRSPIRNEAKIQLVWRRTNPLESANALYPIGKNDNVHPEFFLRAGFTNSFHRSLIPVQPIKDFLHHLVIGRDVSSFQDRVTLVFLGCAQETKHHILCFQRIELVISTID